MKDPTSDRDAFSRRGFLALAGVGAGAAAAVAVAPTGADAAVPAGPDGSHRLADTAHTRTYYASARF